jgi:predicted ArsR family transcriptional regulator
MDDPRLDAVGAPELRAALAYVRSQSAPVSADDLAAAQRIHRNVARARLERLARAGLLDTSFERRTGRVGPGAGRPAKLYVPASELEAIEFPNRRLPDLVALLAAGMPRRRLRAAGEGFGRLLAADARLEAARDVEAGLRRICAAVGRLGFQVSVADRGSGHALLVTPTCPLRPLVVVHPEAAEIDRGLWAGLAESGIGGVRAGRVDCRTRGCAEGGLCAVSLRF